MLRKSGPARALDPNHRPEGSWALGTRMRSISAPKPRALLRRYSAMSADLESKDMAEENFQCSQLILGILSENPRAVEAQSRMEHDLHKVGREKPAIEEITKTLNEVHFASTIKLNVGGKIYETTLDTLRKDPDSMLCAMFSGRFELKANERDGAYFIDRDGKLFR